MKKINLMFLGSLVFLIFFASCQRSDNYNREAEEECLGVIGQWQLREVNNGVIYRAEFIEDGRLSQYFEDHTGYIKKRFGNWEVQGDTLFIEERQGAYSFFIAELSDSLMLLVRTDSTTMLFDRIDYSDLP
ncbi:hypothetical protein [Porphyromonas levii]|uniref:hypothetical protein n=2 Tax=Porphyromonas levii TaxID=28114 RepID=UPI00037C4823|nr:hypothetical protein [Porphyromonas levii]MBR8729782.1 hypothetical protein [Porphyromonas levii]MBR8806902.1 hypothetical protein [Porphyromonas levii]TFH95923.1 hypothetical protein E4P48_06395 [Porphyromonas levii]